MAVVEGDSSPLALLDSGISIIFKEKAKYEIRKGVSSTAKEML